MDSRLIDLTPEDQTEIVEIHLDYLTTGHAYFGYRVQYSTLLGYMDYMAAWVETHTGRDQIRGCYYSSTASMETTPHA